MRRSVSPLPSFATVGYPVHAAVRRCRAYRMHDAARSAANADDVPMTMSLVEEEEEGARGTTIVGVDGIALLAAADGGSDGPPWSGGVDDVGATDDDDGIVVAGMDGIDDGDEVHVDGRRDGGSVVGARGENDGRVPASSSDGRGLGAAVGAATKRRGR